MDPRHPFILSCCSQEWCKKTHVPRSEIGPGGHSSPFEELVDCLLQSNWVSPRIRDSLNPTHVPSERIPFIG